MKVAAENIADTLPGDSGIIGIRWLNDEMDIVLDLSIPGSTGKSKGHLFCTWASNVRIDIDMAPYSGVIPAFHHEVVKTEDGNWRVYFDLSPTGSISLLCNDVVLELQDSGVTI